MKHLIIFFLFLYCIFGFGQKPTDDIKMLEGVWIAEDYYNSFEKTNSAVKSKKSFHFNDPAGLRINSNEIKNGIVNIGYAELHHHLLFPEVSDYIVKNKDTIHEQGNFKINLNKKDSLGYFKTTDISYFNYSWVSYLKWNKDKTSLTLYRPKGKDHKEKYIRYKRILTDFDADYLFPNPIYYYTRSKTLTGNYTLKDNKGVILSKNFEIKENGIANGFKEFENFTFYYSTDIYCGLPLKSDLIIICEDILNDKSKRLVFLMDRDENGDINLHKRRMSNKEEAYVLGEKIYELIKN